MHGNESPKSIRVRLWEEARLMLWVFLYIFLVLAALAAYRAVLLGAKGAPLSAIVQCVKIGRASCRERVSHCV